MIRSKHSFLLAPAAGLLAVAAIAIPQSADPSAEPAAAQERSGARALRPASAVQADDAADSAPVRSFLGGEDPASTPPSNLEYELREKLSLTDLDARESAFDAVAKAAAMGSDARRALQAIADDLSDPDVAFTARLALREADRKATWGRAGSAFGNGLQATPTDPVEAMRQRMESIFGADPFVSEFFTNDPFQARPFGGRTGQLGLSPFGGGDPFEDMQRRVDEIRQQVAELERSGARVRTRGASPFQRRSQSSSISVESSGDGVRVQVTENDGSGPNTITYEGDSIEALLEAHPELKGRIGGR